MAGSDFDCPRCSPGSGHFRLGLSLARGAFSCWQCGFVPRKEAVAGLLGVSEREAGGLLGGLERPLPPAIAAKAPGRLVLPDGLGPLLPPHRRYLKGRGYDPDELAAVWGLQGIGLAARLAWRLFIPVTRRGVTVSWTTRSLTDGGRRYVAADESQEAVPAKSLLYGADLVPGRAVIVVEGPADAWAVGPGAVATLGTSTSSAQVRRLLRYPVRYLCFDSEPGGQRRATRLLRDLSAFAGRTFNVVLDAKDPGSAKPKELRALRVLLARGNEFERGVRI